MYIIVRRSGMILMHLDDQYVFTNEDITMILNDYLEYPCDISEIDERIIHINNVFLVNLHFIGDDSKFSGFSIEDIEEIYRLGLPFTRDKQIEELLK